MVSISIPMLVAPFIAEKKPAMLSVEAPLILKDPAIAVPTASVSEMNSPVPALSVIAKPPPFIVMAFVL